MIKKLRKRLTIIFTLFTGGVFAVVLISAFITSLYQTNNDGEFRLSVAVSEVANYVAFYSTTPEVLTEIEEKNSAAISISFEEETLDSAPGFSTQSDRAELWAKLNTKMENSPSNIAVTHRFDVLVGVVDSVQTEENTAPAEAQAAAPSEEAGKATDEDIGYSVTATQLVASDLYSSIAYTQLPTVKIQGNAGDSYRGYTWEFMIEEKTYNISILQDRSGEIRRIALLSAGYGAALLGGIALLAFINWRLTKTLLKPTEDGMQRQAAFVAAASHELRSPLAVMRSSLSAAEAAPTAKQAQKYRHAAETEAERMSRLVDDLLLLAGGDADNWALQPFLLDVDTLLIETHEHTLPLAKEKKLDLKLDLPNVALGEITADADRVRQILQILLDNALEYAPSGTAVTLAAQRHKNQLELRIIDHGPGIAAESKDKIFDRFYRADNSRSDKAHFGLGLSIAKELAELHKGSLSAEETPGGGATFVLKLPCK